MSALGELRTGQAGDQFAALLGRTIKAVAIARNIPPPEGRRSWDDESVGIVVSEFMTDAGTPRRLTDLTTVCMSDAAVRARLQGTVRNFLADLGRRTPIGKLVVRVNEVLGRRDEFTRVDGRWAIAFGPFEPGVTDDEALGRAIRSHPIVVPKWGHDARRSGPVADADSIVSLCRTLLEAAGGSLTPRAMAATIGRRLGIGQAPVAADINALDGGWPDLGQATDQTGSEALRAMRAREIMGLLNDRERCAIAFHEYTVRQLAPLLDVSASRAHVIRRHALELVKAELVDDDDAEGVAMQVLELASAWALDWTTPADPTY